MAPYSRRNGLESHPNATTILPVGNIPGTQRTGKMMTTLNMSDELEKILQQVRIPGLDELLVKLASSVGKKSFLVFRDNKYFNVATENIAFFYVRFSSASIMCFDQQEYFVNYSLEQIQALLPEKQFFRLNRQYLISFNAIREVEHYFARKLLVNSVVAAKEKLLVSKEKVSEFLHWLDNR